MTKLQDQISFSQNLTIIDPENSIQIDLEIDIDELLNENLISLDKENSIDVTNKTKEKIIEWLHTKTMYRLQLLEIGKLEDRQKAVLNLINLQNQTSQLIIQDLLKNNPDYFIK